MSALTPASTASARPAGTARRVLTLTRLLARPSRQGRAAIVLPIVAFAVTTALLLIVIGGVQMFLTDPRAQTDAASTYAPLSIFALVLLSVPIATLGAAAARLSARQRNDRLATLRLLGATSFEVGAMTVLEAAATAVIGAMLGVVLSIALLPLVGLLPFFGGPVGAGALWTGPAIAAIAVAAVALVATGSAALSLRRVQLTPLGVRRRTDAPPRRTAALVAGAIALVTIVTLVSGMSSLGEALGPLLGMVILFGLFAGALLVVNLIGTPLIAARGRAMARKATTAARLIAGRELAAHADVAWRRVSGIAMIAFIAVIGGSGASMVAFLGDDSGSAESILFSDIRTGVLVTLAVGFVLLACSVGVTQAASALEDRDLIVGLDRLGMQPSALEQSRVLTVMVPLRWAAVGGTAMGAALAFPLVGVTVMVAPVSLAIIAGTVIGGILIVRLALRTTTPLITAIRRSV